MADSREVRILPLSAAPPHLSASDYAAATSSTPASFDSIPSKLVLGLQNVIVSAEPPLLGVDNAVKGEMWVTEEALSYLPSTSQQGFSLPFPLLALHAVSSSLPGALKGQQLAHQQCIYCQIDDSSMSTDMDDEEEEGEDEMGLREMWIVPENADDVEPLFSALSHCASLHPSIGGDGDDDSSNPFAGMGPFGTGLDGHMSQYEDADEAIVGFDGAAGSNVAVSLSEAGRAQLSRLDALLGEDESEAEEEEEEQSRARASTPEQAATSFPTANDDEMDTNVILLQTSPQPLEALFTAPLLQSLLALLDAYLPVLGWDPQPEAGTMRVVFDDRQLQASTTTTRSSGIARIISTLDSLPLETEEGHTGPPPELTVTPLPRINVSSLLPSNLTSALPSLSIPETSSTKTNTTSAYQPTDHLLPPSTDRNFLISPPGSPPIGWEPIREDPPNRDTLASDLMEALRKLGRDMEEGGVGAGAGGIQAVHASEVDLTEDSARGANARGDTTTGISSNSNNSNNSHSNVSGSGSGSGGSRIHVVVPPSHRRLPSLTGTNEADQPPIPAVTVEAFDEDDDNEDGMGSGSRTAKPGQKRDITQVKATVESLIGGSSGEDGSAGEGGQLGQAGLEGQGGGKRITPTGRPPLV